MPAKVTITPQQSEEAQEKVKQAIDELDTAQIYQEILSSLRADVAPLWSAYWTRPREPGEKVRFYPGERYIRAEQALEDWAKKFNLVVRETGSRAFLRSTRIRVVDEPVEWVLNWGLALCRKKIFGTGAELSGTLLSGLHAEHHKHEGFPQSLAPTSPFMATVNQIDDVKELPSGASEPLPDVPPPYGLRLSLYECGPFSEESRGEFKKRVMREVDSELDAIFNEAKAARKSKPKSSHRKKRQDAHYRWFVLYQCAGWRYSDIRDHQKLSDSDPVRKGVERVAKEVGITVRRRNLAPQKNRIKFPL